MNAALHDVFSHAEVRGELGFHVGFEEILDIIGLRRRTDFWGEKSQSQVNL